MTATPPSPPPTPSAPPQARQRPDEPWVAAPTPPGSRSQLISHTQILVFVFVLLSDIRRETLHRWRHQVIFLLQSVNCITLPPFSILVNCERLKPKMKSHLHMWRFGSRDGNRFFSFMLQVHFPQRWAYCLGADLSRNKDCSCLPDRRASEFISALSKVSMKSCPLGGCADLMLQDNKGDARRRTQTARDTCQRHLKLHSIIKQ